jgi:hypothetical protein
MPMFVVVLNSLFLLDRILIRILILLVAFVPSVLILWWSFSTIRWLWQEFIGKDSGKDVGKIVTFDVIL